tara:strand:- start:23798 stop:25096 length:1299 start_codon:yes stop_codon:yes gene_type:complete
MKAPPWNVLVFPAGTEVGLEIFRSLEHCKEVRLFGASAAVVNHGPCVFARYRELPSIDHADALDALKALIEAWEIDFIFPANPLVMDFLDEHRSEIPCAVVMPASATFNIVRSKSASYKHLAQQLPVPELHDAERIDRFPVYLKPDRLYGSQGGQRLDSRHALAAAGSLEGMLLCEYLPGDEYTVDCFSSSTGQLLFAGPRTRERIRMGTSMHSREPDSETHAALLAHALQIHDALDLTGPWFFQMKRDAQGTLKLLEIDPRIAGTMAFHRVQGINFPLLGLLDKAGMSVRILRNPYRQYSIDRALTNRYRLELRYSTVYVDWDDTLVIKEALNTQMLQFLYQCINQGKRIVLLSKSLAADKEALLARWRLQSLFDEIHWLREDESKSDYIHETNAIFIDDSFTQREEVSTRLGILTFDPSMVEILLDDRGH